LRSLAIIPARAGSKGVKNKNIREVCGKALIYYSIHSAKESKKLTNFVVSTDGDNIDRISKQYGARVIKRSQQLAQDDTPIVEVVKNVLFHLKSKGEVFDLVILLQPTSPIRTGRDIDETIEMFENDIDLEGVVSVVPMEEIHPARMYNLDSHKNLVSLNSDYESTQRQQIVPVYYRNGCIYAVTTKAFKKYNSLMVPRKKAYVMPLKWLVNIDDERDLKIAEIIMAEWLNNDSL